ncbi:MAG: CCA tRNA nucleotidyltransferase [Phycisphaeraceae bacterium]|nr:CCA tRNA nucleotidyltransferase [Phycisphaeraceae bacterium]
MNARPSSREAAIRVVGKLQKAGYVAYLAGGCVRDRLLGLEPKDHDVATDATPDRVLQLYPKAQRVGEAFGVVLVRAGGCPIEVATFRCEDGYSDGRHPDQVQFTDAEHDAQRRDFTINALFEDPIADRVIDFVGGQEDLQARRIRSVGDPDERFGEDYLRLLRAVRFAARLDFQIEIRTSRAIRNLGRYLGQISRERIGQEIGWMLTAPRPQRMHAAKLLQDYHLDGPVLLEDHLAVALPTLAVVAEQSDFAQVLAAWMLDRHLRDAGSLTNFADQHLDNLAHRWRKAMCLSNDTRDLLLTRIRLAAAGLAWPTLPKAGRKRWLAQAQTDRARQLLRALRHVHGIDALVDQIDREANPLLEEGVAPFPYVTGDDLLEMGLRPGPAIGKLLEAAYDRQLEGDLKSRDASLAWLREQTPQR